MPTAYARRTSPRLDCPNSGVCRLWLARIDRRVRPGSGRSDLDAADDCRHVAGSCRPHRRTIECRRELRPHRRGRIDRTECARRRLDGPGIDRRPSARNAWSAAGRTTRTRHAGDSTPVRVRDYQSRGGRAGGRRSDGYRRIRCRCEVRVRHQRLRRRPRQPRGPAEGARLESGSAIDLRGTHAVARSHPRRRSKLIFNRRQQSRSLRTTCCSSM